MDDLGSRLRQIHRRVSSPEPAFDRLVDRRRRKRRNSRIASLAMAFIVVGAGLAGAVVALGHTGTARQHGTADGGGTGPNLVAGPGQYYYSKTQIYYDEYAPNEPDLGTQGPWTIEQWFGTDASGRAVFVDDKAASGNISYGWNGPPDKTYGPGRMPLE